MAEARAYSYAVLRVVPRVERDEFINAGVILFSQETRFLGARVSLDERRLHALACEADAEVVQRHLQAIVKICAGEVEAGVIAKLPQKERFHWLTAPRSTVLQISPIRTGLTADPRATLDHLLSVLVL